MGHSLLDRISVYLWNRWDNSRGFTQFDMPILNVYFNEFQWIFILFTWKCWVSKVDTEYAGILFFSVLPELMIFQHLSYRVVLVSRSCTENCSDSHSFGPKDVRFWSEDRGHHRPDLYPVHKRQCCHLWIWLNEDYWRVYLVLWLQSKYSRYLCKVLLEWRSPRIRLLPHPKDEGRQVCLSVHTQGVPQPG